MGSSVNSLALTTAARVKSRGGLVSGFSDVEIDHQINAVSSEFESYCGRFFRSRTWTHDDTTHQRLSSYGGSVLFLRNRPITAVTSLKLFPSTTALTEGYNQHFKVNNLEGYIELVNGNVFYDAVGVVEIIYTAGYLDDPAAALRPLYSWNVAGQEIESACIDTVIDRFHMQDRERARLASRSMEGVSVSYLTDNFLPHVQKVLDKHKAVYF